MSALHAGPPLKVAGACLILVERVWFQQHIHGDSAWVAGGREPVAVVVQEADGVHALDMAGQTLSLNTLLGTVDGLAAALGIQPAAP